MAMEKKLTGSAIATAAAALLLTAYSSALYSEDAPEAVVKCRGINSCKGTAACATANSSCVGVHACGAEVCAGVKISCAGQNSCKGQGWIKTSKSECEARGGEIIG